MLKLGLLTALLAPQIWAAQRRSGTATHLTLLLASMVCIAAFFIFGPVRSDPALAPDLTYMGFAVIGLAGLVPLFWALQQMFPGYDFAVSTVLAQALGLMLAAALVIAAPGAAGPALFEWGALGLVAALYGAGLHVVHTGELK